MMMTMQRIDFHGDEISTCRHEHTGKVYCLPREICVRLGLSWGSQSQKILHSLLYQRHTLRFDIETEGGVRKTVLLDIDYLPAWLAGISAEKVQEGVRDKLLAYQEECAGALRDYWMAGLAQNPRLPLRGRGQFPDLQAIHQLADAIEDTRLLAAAAQQQAVQAEARAAQAEAKSTLALAQQQWLTIHEYVYLHPDLRSVFPEPMWARFGRYLTSYCLQNGYPVRNQGVGGKRYDSEHSYHVGIIHERLPDWLMRQSGQAALTLMPRVEK